MFKQDPKRRFKVIDSPKHVSKLTLHLELALIGIDPSAPVLHTLSWAGPPGTGGGGGSHQPAPRHIRRQAARLDTGKVLATFTDRDMADIGPHDLTPLTWYGPVNGIMDKRAKQFRVNRQP